MKARPFLLAGLLLVLAGYVYTGDTYDSGSAGLKVAGSYVRTVAESAAALAGQSVEVDGLRLQYNFTITGDDNLSSGLRVEANCDMTTPTNPGTDTRHCGAIFAETNVPRNNQYFSFGFEDSIKAFVGALAHATAAAVSHISHVKIFNDQNIAQVFPAIAWNARMDFFTTAFESVSFSTHTFGYFARPEAFYSGTPKALFGWYNPTDRNIQNVNAGNVFKIAVSTVVPGGGTLDLSQACGGKLIITSTASITLSASQFANSIGVVVPSSSTIATQYLDGCEVDIVNGNLNGRTVTVADTSDYTPITGGSEIIGSSGGQIHVWAYGTAAQWVEGQARTK